jgi:hypothetical protein
MALLIKTCAEDCTRAAMSTSIVAKMLLRLVCTGLSNVMEQVAAPAPLSG